MVFFAIGFETTTPPTAMAVLKAAREGLKNFQRVLQPRADARRDRRILDDPKAAARCRSTASSARPMSRR